MKRFWEGNIDSTDVASFHSCDRKTIKVKIMLPRNRT